MSNWMFILQVTGIVAVSLFISLTLFTVGLVLAATERVEEKDGKKRFVKRPWQATKIPTGNTVLTVRGDKLWKIWPNVGGHCMSEEEDFEGRHWLVKVEEPDLPNAKKRERDVRKKVEKKFFHGTFFAGRLWEARNPLWLLIGGWYYLFLWRWLGIRFVSLLYPHNRVHVFDIRSRDRLVEGHKAAPGASLRQRISPSDEDTEIHSLLFKVPRPILVEGVELGGDNSRINILILAIFHQVIPSLAVFYYKGDFFSLLDQAIETGLVDFGASHRVAVFKKGHEKEGQLAYDTYELPPEPKRTDAESDEDYAKKIGKWEDKVSEYQGDFESAPLTLAHWLKIDRGATIENHFLRRFNVTRTFYDRLKKKKPELFLHLHNHVLRGRPPISSEEIADETRKRMLENQIGQGTVPRLGFALETFQVVTYEVHEDSKGLDEAIRLVEVNARQAEAAIRAARGSSEAKKLEALGDEALARKPIESMIGLGVTPDVAAQVFATDRRTANIGGKESKVTTYIEGGGANASVLIPANPPAPPKEPTKESDSSS